MELSKTNFKRLWRLVAHMQKLPASANKHFAMQHYVNHTGDGHEHKVPRKPKVADLHSCGTTACALGWAMTVPSLRKAGLRMNVSAPAYKGDTRDYAVSGENKCFGIDSYYDNEQWEQLFGCRNNDKTPKAWAKRVSKLIRQWEKTA